MKILSVNLGKPQPIEWKGGEVMTGIFKQPVEEGAAWATALGLLGDQQVNLDVHGGEDKAIYAFPKEAYPAFEALYPHIPFQNGFFGENLTVEGLDETRIYIGEHYRIGGTLLEVSECRLPCFKLGVKFGDQLVLKHFVEVGRSGSYFRVLEEGDIRVGDTFQLEYRPKDLFSMSELFRLRTLEKNNRELLEKAVKAHALPQRLLEHYKMQLADV
jgi:MOSC domain-containing protein YiiM